MEMVLALTILAATLTTLRELAAALSSESYNHHCDFCVTGTLSYVVNQYHLLINDGDTGVDIVGPIHPEQTQVGDIVRLVGTIDSLGPDKPKPRFTSIETLGKGILNPSYRQGEAAEIMSGRHDFHLAHLIGEIRDVQESRTASGWNYLTLIHKGDLYYATIPTRGASYSQLEALIGSTVRLEGYPDALNRSFRFLDERRFMVADLEHISIINPPPADPFEKAPSIDKLHQLPIEKISRLGRHKAVGRLLTAWQQHDGLLQLDDNRKVFVSFASSPMPLRNQRIEVLGYPSTDGFTLRLSRSLAHPVMDIQFKETPVLKLSEGRFRNLTTHHSFNTPSLHGRRVQLAGTLSEFNRHPAICGAFQLLVAGRILDIDCSCVRERTHDLAPGCRLRVTGTCVLETENWNSVSNGLQLNGIRLVIDRPDDLEILARPPWWTPRRLAIAVIILLVILLASLLWNRMLHRLSEKRGRELFNERSASAMAELKAEERTRLAVELHDSMSQILTGAAMQLDAGEISTAKRILASCRRELRACLWELRSHAIDAANLADAIRETIEPHLGGRRASVDVDIPSSALSEALRHAALRIVREATVNAIRHGRATLIAVSGELTGKTLSLTVVDNGRGFDPSSVRCSSSGHFGLLGMRERAKAFNGSVNIVSAPGQGTEITVVLQECTGYDFGEYPTDKDEAIT
ncbi:MAG: sensor histidine kinase [bacterium]|nr:sensor histidine kinase [Candidatus Colisoma equi]